VPKVEEFYLFKIKDVAPSCAQAANTPRKRVRCGSETIILGSLDHF